MTDSSNPSHGHKIKEEIDNPNPRLCDFCSESVALLYCRADSAKLCLSCDRQVHSTNQLFTKHTRLLLCDSCDSSPASLFCSTHNSVLCQNCDWEIHSPSSSSHDRRPLEGFSGCPSVTDLFSILGFEDLGKKPLLPSGESNLGSDISGSDYGFSDFLVWDTPSFVSLDDLIVSSAANHNFQAMGVPPLPKNRNAVCGEHKAEMLHQLRELAKLEPKSDDGEIERLIEFQPKDDCVGFEHISNQSVVPQYEANSHNWCSDTCEVGDGGLVLGGGSYNEPNCLVPEKDCDIFGNTSLGNNGGHDETLQSWHEAVNVNESIQVPKVRELTAQERDTAISRYKEKKKSRRYDKHIRYESRKVRAESRTRIRGRFAKMDN